MRDAWSRRDFLRLSGAGAASAALGGGVVELLAACGGPGGQGGTPTPRAGGHIVVGVPTDPQKFTSVLMGDSVSAAVASYLNDPLLTKDANGTLLPLLAEAVPTPSSDGLTITFKLRDASWSDGTPVTADDVAFTYGLLIDPANAGVNSPFASPLRANVSRVTAADARTAVFQMKRPYAPFLSAYCTGANFGILPRHVLGSLTPQALNTADYNANPTVTNGMFKFVKWDRGSQVVLTRNDRYYRGAARLERLVVKTVSGGTVAIANQLKTGEVDVGQIDVSQADSLRTADGVDVLSVDAPGFVYYVYQLDPAKPASRFFGSKDVRHALLLALDRQAMVDAILFKQASVADSPVTRVSWGYSKNVRTKYGFDRAKAEQLLDAAGWQKGADGVRQKNGDPFRFEILLPAGIKYLEDVAASLQDQWKRIGVQATPRTADLATVIVPTFYNTRSFDMVLTPISPGDDPDSMSLLFSSASAAPGGPNASPFKDSRVDALLADGATTFDRAKRAQIYAQVQDIVMDELPVAPLFFQKALLGVTRRVRGIKYSSIGGNSYYKDVWVTDGK
ncbi:MAG TPA: ABC transporter substrate-binding protein [Candidatus Dormibacteraeota bacterium]